MLPPAMLFCLQGLELTQKSQWPAGRRREAQSQRIPNRVDQSRVLALEPIQEELQPAERRLEAQPSEQQLDFLGPGLDEEVAVLQVQYHQTRQRPFVPFPIAPESFVV